MKRSPSWLTRRAPAPRSASVMRKRGAPGHVQAGGVELDELEVEQARAGAGGHGDARPDGARVVGGVDVERAGAAGGEHRGARP